MQAISDIRCFGRWMTVAFPEDYGCASWAIVNGGLSVSRMIAWRFLEIDEIERVPDVAKWFRNELAAEGMKHAVGLLTSRQLHRYVESGEGTGCHVVATVGLSNALAVGDPVFPGGIGTINILCALDQRLSNEASLEALALAAEARTSVMLELQVPSVVSRRPATGTGTDCIVIASPRRGVPEEYCGKHTEWGHRIGMHVREAVRRGAEEWLAETRA